MQKLLDGDKFVTPGTPQGLGLTTGLTELLATANSNRTVACDKLTEVNRVIAVYEAYTYDGGEPAVVDPIVIIYDSWGKIETWSSYRPDLSSFSLRCAATEPEYKKKVEALMVDPESEAKRTEFTECTGVSV